LQFSPSNAIYDGSEKKVTVSVKEGITGVGTITVKYNGRETPPTIPGVYAITVDVSAGRNYEAATRLSLGNFTVGKATQTAPGVPELDNRTATSITLKPVAGTEYRNGATGEWQDSPTFTGLVPETEYTFYARLKSNATHETSEQSGGLTVTTDITPEYGISLNPSGNYIFEAATYGYGKQTAYGVTVVNVGNQPTGTLTIFLSGSGSSSFTLSKTGIDDLASGDNETFTVVPNVGIAIGTYVATVVVSGANGIVGKFDIGFTVNRRAQTAPSAPTLATKTATSVTLNAIAGAEYRNGATGVWQDSPSFTGLVPETDYTFHARLKESNTLEASEPSVGLTVTTDVTPEYGISLNPSGACIFDATVYGYGEQTAYSVAVVNVGSQPTGTLTISLSGSDSSSFTLSKTGIDDLVSGDSETFTVVPNTGLAVGTYVATVVVSGANGISANFDIRFTVNRLAQTAPSAPTLADKTATSVTLNTIADAEYRNSATGEWQDSPSFESLVPYTTYTFYARLKESDTHEASPLSDWLTVTTFDTVAKLISLSVNGIPLTESETFEYTAKCDEQSVILDLVYTPTATATITVNGTPFEELSDIPLTQDMVVTISIVSEDGENRRSYILRMYSALDANTLLFQRWDNVLAINSNPANNGNHNNITGVRWYYGNEVISEEWFIRLSYYVENYSATISLDGEWHAVCGVPKEYSLEKVLAYPNPVSVGDNLNLHLPKHFAGGYMTVFTISGTAVKRNLPLPDINNVINVSDWSPGVYLLNITSPNGNNETVKIIVN
jgi:hypothetical protein